VTEPVLIDTGPVVAILNFRDQHHSMCIETFRRLGTPPITCWPVITEAVWMLRHLSDGPPSVLELVSKGSIIVRHLDQEDSGDVEQMLRAPRHRGLQLADARLVRLATTLGASTVFTLDRRDFSRPDLIMGAPLSIIPDWPKNP
jgi:predicted nucleic acid-binding protein